MVTLLTIDINICIILDLRETRRPDCNGLQTRNAMERKRTEHISRCVSEMLSVCSDGTKTCRWRMHPKSGNLEALEILPMLTLLPQHTLRKSSLPSIELTLQYSRPNRSNYPRIFIRKAPVPTTSLAAYHPSYYHNITKACKLTF